MLPAGVALKLFPLMVTVDPTEPDAGEKPVMEGCAEKVIWRLVFLKAGRGA